LLSSEHRLITVSVCRRVYCHCDKHLCVVLIEEECLWLQVPNTCSL